MRDPRASGNSSQTSGLPNAASISPFLSKSRINALFRGRAFDIASKAFIRRALSTNEPRPTGGFKPRCAGWASLRASDNASMPRSANQNAARDEIEVGEAAQLGFNAAHDRLAIVRGATYEISLGYDVLIRICHCTVSFQVTPLEIMVCAPGWSGVRSSQYPSDTNGPCTPGGILKMAPFGKVTSNTGDVARY
jgi:hypothetical protein